MMKGLENMTSKDGWKDLGLFSLVKGTFFSHVELCGIKKIETEEIIVSVHPWYIGEEVISLNSKTNDLY